MKIEFNANHVTKAQQGRAVEAPSSTKQAGGAAPFENTRALEQKLKDMPVVRPDKVEHGRELVSNVQYPPTELVDRISSLLAIHYSNLP